MNRQTMITGVVCLVVGVVAGLYLALVATSTLLLSMAMYHHKGPAIPFMDLFFEACSACGTVGLTTGVTGRLDVLGELIVTAGMFVGRVGPLTLVLALTVGVLTWAATLAAAWTTTVRSTPASFTSGARSSGSKSR